ncbi:hypothetical protein [Myroides sp. LJL110]
MKSNNLSVYCILAFLLSYCLQGQQIQGRVFDKQTQLPIHKAKISLYDQTGRAIDSVFTNKDGGYNYLPTIPGSVYKITSKAKDYSSAEVLVEQSNQGALVIFGLIATNPGNNKHKLALDHKSHKNPESNLAISESSQYSKANIKEDKQIHHAKNKAQNDPPYIESNEKKGYPEGFLTAVYYDFNSSFLNEQNRSDLQRVTLYLRENPNAQIQMNLFLDTQQNNQEYQQWLLQRRQDRIIDYFISQGISQNRVVPQVKRLAGWPEPLPGQDHSPRNTRRCDFVVI